MVLLCLIKHRHFLGPHYIDYEFKNYSYDPYNIIGNALLAYDRIYVDIKLSPVLCHLLGQDVYEEAIDDNTINFYSFKGEADVNNIKDKEFYRLDYLEDFYNKDQNENLSSKWENIDNRLIFYLKNSIIKFKFKEAEDIFIRKTLSKTTILDNNIRYDDIINEVNSDISLNESIISSFDLERGINKDHINKYDIIKILRIAEYNKGLYVLKALNTSVINLPPGGEHFVYNKYYSPAFKAKYCC